MPGAAGGQYPPSGGGEDEAVDGAMLAAVERGGGPCTYGFSEEVVAADQAGGVYVKALLPAVSIDQCRECGEQLRHCWPHSCQDSPSVTVMSFRVSSIGTVR